MINDSKDQFPLNEEIEKLVIQTYYCEDCFNFISGHYQTVSEGISPEMLLFQREGPHLPPEYRQSCRDWSLAVQHWESDGIL